MTLIIVPIEGIDDSRLLESFDSISSYYKRLQKDRYFNVDVNTEWKMFMYSNEYLSNQLVEAFPIILDNEEFDYFSFYKLALGENNKIKYSISPRLFRSGIELRDNSVYPIDMESLKGTTILDGFIL